MLLHIPNVLSPKDVADACAQLNTSEWANGRGTAGHLSVGVKRNSQLHFQTPAAQQVGGLILDRLEQNALFIAAALPHRILPPLFNRYGEGEYYGPHLDGAIRTVDGTPHRIRTDVSATLFLTPPEDYDGGELTIVDSFGSRRVKLPAGDMLLYPGTSVHHVAPVTRGVRLASYFWVQSLVRDAADRSLLFDLDTAIQRMNRETEAERANVVHVSNVYHNLMRRWADL